MGALLSMVVLQSENECVIFLLNQESCQEIFESNINTDVTDLLTSSLPQSGSMNTALQ